MILRMILSGPSVSRVVLNSDESSYVMNKYIYFSINCKPKNKTRLSMYGCSAQEAIKVIALDSLLMICKYTRNP